MNVDKVLFYKWMAEEGIFFLTFIFLCAALAKSRFTAKKTAVVILSGVLLCIIANAAVFLGSHDITLTMGALALTAYAPAIIVLHLLSDSSFFRTISIWCTGLIGVYVERILIKIIIQLCSFLDISNRFRLCDIIEILALLILMALLCFVTVKYIRSPFHRYIRCFHVSWSLPIALVFLLAVLFSYFSNSSQKSIEILLLFLTTITVLLLIAKLFWTEYTKQQLKKEQEEYETRFRLQQKEYQEITRKHEQLREYRHDMRHHLLALSNILYDSDSHHAKEYVDALVQRLEQTEHVVYCKNKMINAILSSYLTRAKELDCELDTQISIPEMPDIEQVDLCTVLSNALENAVNACEKEDKNHRFIKIRIVYKNVLTISIKNSCSKEIVFDKNNLPSIKSRQGHGIGMKSIANTVEKYGGTLKCECENGEFKLNILMFCAEKNEYDSPVKNTRKAASSVLFSLVGLCAFLFLSPIVTESLTEFPVVGPIVQVITAGHHRSGWGSSEFEVEEPKVTLEPFISHPIQESVTDSPETETARPVTTDAAVLSAETFAPSDAPAAIEAAAPANASAVMEADESIAGEASVPSAVPKSYANLDTVKPLITVTASPGSATDMIPVLPETATENNSSLEAGVNEINENISEYTETLRQAYYWYLIHKHMGYTALDATYDILCNNKDMLSIKIDGTLNVGGSADFSRCFTLDKRTGNVIELSDLFQKDADYITPISEQILEQMAWQVENSNASYFIPGGIWSDEECFKSISEDQNFYINDQNKLVIAFDEYEVAPGSMGCVEFVIPTDVIDSILVKPSLIQ